jgi:hypothetical protein
MSLFQCDRCGCLENTACTNGYHIRSSLQNEKGEAVESYRQIMGLKPGQPFGAYCSVCTPVWFTEEGAYGVGPHSESRWHGKFERRFLPKGLFHTNEDGNLAHIETLNTDVDKYALAAEEDFIMPAYFHRMDRRLPHPSNTEECKRHIGAMQVVAKAFEEAPYDDPTVKSEGNRRALLNHFAEMGRRACDEQVERSSRHRMRASTASLLALAFLSADKPAKLEPRPPRPSTPADEERWAKQAQDKVARAQAKRARKGAKFESNGT